MENRKPFKERAFNPSMDSTAHQEETQMYAAQGSFLVLISHLISEHPDLNMVLSQSLRQVVELMNAWIGEIWLYSDDGAWLDLTSSLIPPLAVRRPVRRAINQGLIGWVADQGFSLCLDVSENDVRFDQEVDSLDRKKRYAILAVPLRHRRSILGVLAVYRLPPKSFKNGDVFLLEDVANMIAWAISNSQTMQVLHAYADQQRALYEMSQQITAGLDMNTTIQQSLQWINRLCDAEVSLLWLKGEKDQPLRLAATLGIRMPEKERLALRLENCLVQKIESGSEFVLIKNADEDPHECLLIFDHLQVERRNLLVIPMKNQGELFGTITLLNKTSGAFSEAEVALLSTAIKMIAIAISNARLYEQSLRLIRESKRLHKIALQNERLATIGRLTASLAHEINNPLQVIQGALTLAMEDLQNLEELTEYLTLSLQEVQRVGKHIQRIRQICHPPLDKPEKINIYQLLQDVCAAANEETSRLNIRVSTNLVPTLGIFTGVTNQLHLAFLSILLKISETIGESGNGELQIRALDLGDAASIEFVTGVPDLYKSEESPAIEQPSGPNSLDELLGLSLAQDIILAHGGSLDLKQSETETCLQVILPQTRTDNE